MPLDQPNTDSATGLWDAARTWYLQGNTDRIRQNLPALADLSSSETLPRKDRLRIAAVAAQGFCLTLEIEPALRCLSPILDPDSASPRINEGALAEIAAWDACLAGRLLTPVCNILYRTLEYEQGARLARRAQHYFETTARLSGEGLECFLGRVEGEVWALRLDWRAGHHVDFTFRIGTLVRELVTAYPKWEREAGGQIDLLLSLALNRWAVFDLAKGNLDAARKRIYRALYLLSGGTVQDSIRLAYTLYTAARIESSISTSDFIWARRLQRQAGDLFGSIRHPFLLRSNVHLAVCYIKARRFDEARSVLLRVKEALNTIADRHELNLVDGETKLAELLIAEHEAGDNPDFWEKCASMAGKLAKDARSGKLTTRLLAEGEFHLGRAHVLLDRHEEGRAELLQAVETAKRDGRVKIQAAAHLVLAESYIDTNDMDKAQEHWVRSERLQAKGTSSYLIALRSQIAPRLGSRISLDIGSKSYSEAKDEFLQAYLDFHFKQHGDNVDEFLEATGLTRSSFYRLRQGTKREPPAGK